MADKYLNQTVLTYFYNRLKTVFAEQADIPTATSDLTNDSGFITSTDVPTLTSELTNDSGFIDNTVNNLVNYYTSTNTYTKTEVDNLIGSITGIEFEIVQTLPATGDAGAIYLVPNSGSAPNIYDEYIYANNAWEKIGTTDIDLSAYWAKADLVAITTAEIDTMMA